MRKLIIVGILFVGFVQMAKAEPVPMSPELKSFLMRPDQEHAVVDMMFQQWSALVENCPTPQLKQTNVVVSSSPTFSIDGIPVSGSWRIIGRVEGCEKTRIFNILYSFTSDGRMVRTGLLPGTTAADLRLQKDALMYASMGMIKLAPKDCKNIQYTDTKFVGFGEVSPLAIQGRENRSWTEEWTVRACGVTGVVAMHFIPNASGTAIVSEADETKQINP